MDVVKSIENKQASMVVFSSIFSVILFFLLYALLSDTIDDFTGATITEESESSANFILLVYGICIFGIIIASNLLSDVEVDIAVISSGFAYVITTAMVFCLSYLSLLIKKPSVFYTDEGYPVEAFTLILNFGELNTKFAIYVLPSVESYFFVNLGIMLVSSFLMTRALGGFKTIKH